jgi:hypothetical protein
MAGTWRARAGARALGKPNRLLGQDLARARRTGSAAIALPRRGREDAAVSWYTARYASDPAWRKEQIAAARAREDARRERDPDRFRAYRREASRRCRERDRSRPAGVRRAGRQTFPFLHRLVVARPDLRPCVRSPLHPQDAREHESAHSAPSGTSGTLNVNVPFPSSSTARSPSGMRRGSCLEATWPASDSETRYTVKGAESGEADASAPSPPVRT